MCVLQVGKEITVEYHHDGIVLVCYGQRSNLQDLIDQEVIYRIIACFKDRSLVYPFHTVVIVSSLISFLFTDRFISRDRHVVRSVRI